MVSQTYQRYQEALDNPTMVTHSHGPFRQLGLRIWEQAEDSGWHKGEDTVYHYLSALMSEVGEAHNAYRDHKTARTIISNVAGYDHVTGEPILETPGKPEGFGPELADVIIRACHLAEFAGIDLDYEVREKMNYITLREQRKREYDN